MSRQFLVPEFWLTAKISSDALRTAIAVGMHRNKEGISFVKNEQLKEILGKHTRQIQYDLTSCESAGLITKKYDENGKRFFVFNVIKKTGAIPMHPMKPDNIHPCSESASPHAMPLHPMVQSDCIPPCSATAPPPDNPPYRKQSTFQSTIQSTAAGAAEFSSSSSGEVERQLEPFEAGMVPSSPPIRVAPVESRQPVRFESPDLGELKNKFFEVLGPWAESIHRKISHEMIDSGFVAWLLEECRSVETPYKLFQHKLKTEWQGGNWVRPEELKRLAKAEKLRKHEEFLRSLT